MITTASLIILIFLVILAAGLFATDPSVLGPVDTGKALQAAAVTKTASFNGAGLDLGSGYAPGGGGQPFQCAIPVSAADFASTDETYSFKMQHSDDDSTYTDCGAAVSALAASVGGTVLIHGTVTKRYVRYALTIAGTTPSITYGPAYLVPKNR